MKTKTAKCPFCCPAGGACFSAEVGEVSELTADYWRAVESDEPVKVWECQNCGFCLPRRVNRSPDESTPITPAQVRAITQCQLAKLWDRQEVKVFEVRQHGGFVSVYVEVGRIGDEGTLASVFCRYRGHFFIGRRGKIQAKRGKASKAKLQKYPLIYGWE